MTCFRLLSLPLGAWLLLPLYGQQSVPPKVESGFVTSSDGVRLYYEKVGSGSEIAVRAHFGIEKPDLIGFSYLGKIVVVYANSHGRRGARIPRKEV